MAGVRMVRVRSIGLLVHVHPPLMTSLAKLAELLDIFAFFFALTSGRKIRVHCWIETTKISKELLAFHSIPWTKDTF